jgi:hypothetical protein
MIQTLELLSKAWRAVVPHMEAGTDWHGDLGALTEEWTRRLLGGPESPSETTVDPEALWQSFLGQWGPLFKPWLASAGLPPDGDLDEGASAPGAGLARMLALDAGALSHLLNVAPEADLAFRRVADIPRVGHGREHAAALLRAFDAFVELRRAATKYRALVAETLGVAVQRTMERLTALAGEGKSIDSIRELNRMWLGVADEAFTEVYGSDRYVRVMRELNDAGMKHRIAQRDVVEQVSKALDIPTRGELDDAYRTIYELRKRVKALEKAIHEVERAKAKTAPRKRKKPPAKPARRSGRDPAGERP